MTRRALVIGAVFAVGVVSGTAADVPSTAPARVLEGYHVLATDFHVHSFPFTWSTVSPCGTVREARHNGLDVIAMTPHNQVWAGTLGRWCAATFGGPLVLIGEEVTAPGFHLLAVGITDDVAGAARSLSGVLDAVHAQGGIAIAAHPYENAWPAYDSGALAKLDAAEIVRPEALHDEHKADVLRAFSAKAPLAAIGSTDYHGLGPVGYARTYVFARERSEQGVLDAVRERRTVVYDRSRVYGDPEMIRIAERHGGLPRALPAIPARGAGLVVGRIAAIAALLAALFFNRW